MWLTTAIFALPIHSSVQFATLITAHFVSRPDVQDLVCHPRDQVD